MYNNHITHLGYSLSNMLQTALKIMEQNIRGVL